MSANDIISALSAVVDAVISILAAGLHAAGRAALANIHTAEWTLAAALTGSAWLISIGRGWRVAGLLAFSLAVAAGAWLCWKTGHTGMVAQQAVLAAMVLHGLKGRGWSLAGKGGAK